MQIYNKSKKMLVGMINTTFSIAVNSEGLRRGQGEFTRIRDVVFVALYYLLCCSYACETFHNLKNLKSESSRLRNHRQRQQAEAN